MTVGPSAERGLGDYLAERSDYVVYVGMPLDQPVEWVRVQSYTGRQVVTNRDETIAVQSVQSFVVAYPNGQILQIRGVFAPAPENLEGLTPRESPRDEVLDLDALVKGAKLVIISHGAGHLDRRGAYVYATTLRNISLEKVRVLRFAAYSLTDGKYRLNTVTGEFYSADEFRNWYGLGNQEWMLPDQSVSDMNNYGVPGGYWAYFCETESGKRFVAGAVVP